ncbi:MAG TPA: hypothetical protein VF791_04990 [Pyrinomonadaceae bacterium]
MNSGEIQELINNAIRELGQVRSEETHAASELTAMRKELEASERWQTHSDIRKEAKERVSVLEADVKKLTVEYFEATGDKKAHEAAYVRVTETLEYDEEEALTWARANLPEALTLDVDAFEEYVKGMRKINPLPFVAFKKEPQPCIARDLSRFTGEGES